jgi:hypothetical protein
MTNADKLILSSYLVKQAYANYLTAGGDSYSPDPVIRGLATHNLGENTSNMTTNHLAKTQAFAPPAPAPEPAPKKDPNTMFKTYMGTEYDPKSRVDKNKLKFLQSLQSEGMNLEDVKGNQADIYKRMKGMRF